MDEASAILRHARKNFRQAERNLRNVEAEVRDNQDILLKARLLLRLTTDELSSCSDPSRRSELIDILARGHDNLRKIERIAAHFDELQRSAQSALDRAHLTLREAQAPASTGKNTPPATPSS